MASFYEGFMDELRKLGAPFAALLPLLKPVGGFVAKNVLPVVAEGAARKIVDTKQGKGVEQGNL